LDQNKLKNALFFGKAVTVFSAQVVRNEDASTTTLKSFKTRF